MNISELIEVLQRNKEQHGDLSVVLVIGELEMYDFNVAADNGELTIGGF